MSQHRYILEPYKGMNTRHTCPNCQQREKTFSLYIDTATGEHVHPTVGRCNRESNCGNHYTPKQYFQDNKETISAKQKQYKQGHAEETKQYLKQYKQTHKKIRTCSCGGKYNDGRTDHRNQHYGSKHHIEFVNNFYDRLHSLLVPEDDE